MKKTMDESCVIKKKILLVDGEEGMYDPFKIKLEEEGYEVLTADDGLVAWELIQKKKPDLLITELALPNLNAEGLLQRIQDEKVDPLPEVILATVFEPWSSHVKRVMEKFKVALYMGKPFSIKELLKNVHSILTS